MRYFLFILVLVGCSAAPDIEGVYVSSFEHEFGKTADTLEVRRENEFYVAERRIGLQRKLDGKIFPKELRSEHWILQYNAEKKLLMELRKGKMLLLNEDGFKLGNRQYKRL